MTENLISLIKLLPLKGDGDIKYLGNEILITSRPPTKAILSKIGGIGSKMTWEVTGLALLENKVWAASVKPVPENAKIHTDSRQPMVVLAHRRNAQPSEAGKIHNWQPVLQESCIRFETRVGERNLLRIENESATKYAYRSKAFKRKHTGSEEQPPLGPSFAADNTTNFYRPQQQQHQPRSRGGHNPHRGGGAGGGGGRGGYRGNSRGGGSGGGSGRGRGRPYQYRSLDDVNERSSYAGGYQNNYQSYGY